MEPSKRTSPPSSEQGESASDDEIRVRGAAAALTAAEIAIREARNNLGEGRLPYETRSLFDALSSFLHNPLTEEALLKDREREDAESRRKELQTSNQKTKMENIATSVAPFLSGWKYQLLRGSTIFRDSLPESSAPVEIYVTDIFGDRTFINMISSKAAQAFGQLNQIYRQLGFNDLAYFEEVDQKEIANRFRKYRVPTTWEAIEAMDKDQQIRFFDFHQILDGVQTGEITNCLIDTEDHVGLPVYPVYANVRGSPLRLRLRFIGHDAYIDFDGYIKRIASYTTTEKDEFPLLHVDGLWKKFKTDGNSGIVHDLGPVQVAGYRKLSVIAKEMTHNGAPSTRTIKHWRQKFGIVLSTSTLWIKWRKVNTQCEILRCENGKMVHMSAILSFNRSFGADISMDPAFEFTQEETVSNSEDRIVSFDEVVKLVEQKVPPECLHECLNGNEENSVTDEEVARALYIASSWFNLYGPRGCLGKDCAWGNSRLNNALHNTKAETVDWIPTTKEVKMAGWKLVPEVITPTGRRWGKLMVHTDPCSDGEQLNCGIDDGLQSLTCSLGQDNSICRLDLSQIHDCKWG